MTDTSGKENNGKASGVRWTADGRKGGAYDFTADGDEIVVSNNVSLNPKQLTLAAWIKTSAKDNKWRRIFDKSYSQGYALSIAGGLAGQPVERPGQPGDWSRIALQPDENRGGGWTVASGGGHV